MFDNKGKIEVPDSIPRIYFKYVAIASPDNKKASIILCDILATELETEGSEVKGVGYQLMPVMEIITDMNGLSILRDAIDNRLEKSGFIPSKAP